MRPSPLLPFSCPEAFAMNYLPFTLLLALSPALAVNADDAGNDAPLTINGCVIAEASQCPGANLRGAKLANQDLRKSARARLLWPNLASCRLASPRLASCRSALLNQAISRSAACKLARCSFAPDSLANCR